MTFRISLKAAFLTTTILGLSATEVAAQQLDEVVVTARKRTENLQDIPLTITAFSSEAIERRGIKSVEDVVKFTPGLNYDKGFAVQDTRISIRGLPVVRGKPPVGVLLDGIDISSESIATAGGSSLVNIKLVDVESIAVVKGPQSALYGRSAFGGAVVYTSKKPNLTTMEGTVSVEAGTYGAYEGRAAVSFPIVEDKVAVRINGVYSVFDGFYKNSITNKTIGGDKLRGVSAAIRFKPTVNSDFTLRSSYSDDRSEARPSYYVGGANGMVQQLALPASAVGQRLGVPPGGAPLPATYTFGRIGLIDVKGNSIRLSADPLTGTDFAGGRLRPFVTSLVGDIDFGAVKLSSWTGYTTARSSGRTDSDFYGFPSGNVTLPSPGFAEQSPALFFSDIKVKATQFSQELRLGSDTGRFRWALGGLYWQERYTTDNGSLSVSGNGKAPGFSAARAVQILGQQPFSRNERNTDHVSGYGMLAYDITDHIEANLEARYAHEKVDSVLGQALNLGGGTVAAPTPFYFFGATPINPTPTYSTDMFTPRAVLRYKFDAKNNIYISFAKGEKPGGYLNVAVVTDSRLARYNPEKIYNYEVGFKTSWLNERVRFNGSYFHADNRDRLSQILIPDASSPQGSVTRAVNIGEVKIDGAELEVTAAIAEGLVGAVAYTYIDARYTSSDSAQASAFGAAAAGNCTISTIGLQRVCITNTNGNQLDFSAKHSLSASLNYVRPVSENWNFDVSADAQYRSRRFVDATNRFYLPSYWNVDLQIGASSKTYGVMFYVNNLLDNREPKSAQVTGDTYAITPPQLIYTAYAADRRQLGVRLNAKF